MRTWKSVDDGCRWRFWRAHSARDRYASEVAEHICNGQRVWIARHTPAGTSWLIDEQPVTLLAVLDHMHGAHYHWVLEQTMNALSDTAPTHDNAHPATDPDGETPILGEIHELMLEVMRLAHAGDALEAHMPITFRPGQPADMPLHDRVWTNLAS